MFTPIVHLPKNFCLGLREYIQVLILGTPSPLTPTSSHRIRSESNVHGLRFSRRSICHVGLLGCDTVRTYRYTPTFRRNILSVTQNSTDLGRKQKITENWVNSHPHKNRLHFSTVFSQLEYIGLQPLFYCFQTSPWVLGATAILLSNPLYIILPPSPQSRYNVAFFFNFLE
jgi:hypothetical protein